MTLDQVLGVNHGWLDLVGEVHTVVHDGLDGSVGLVVVVQVFATVNDILDIVDHWLDELNSGLNKVLDLVDSGDNVVLEVVESVSQGQLHQVVGVDGVLDITNGSSNVVDSLSAVVDDIEALVEVVEDSQVLHFEMFYLKLKL